MLWIEDLCELVQEPSLVDLEDEVLVEFNLAEELEDFFSVEIEFEEFDEHGDETLLEEGIDALDAVVDDFDDDCVFVAG